MLIYIYIDLLCIVPAEWIEMNNLCKLFFATSWLIFTIQVHVKCNVFLTKQDFLIINYKQQFYQTMSSYTFLLKKYNHIYTYDIILTNVIVK